MTDKTDTTALVIAEELNEWARDYAPTELATALATCAAVLLKKQNARIAELEALQAAPPAPAPVAVPIELQGVKEAVEQGSGFWRSCAGCHELNEGHATGPVSKVFGCALGNGCSECGGIGAVWDDLDYGAMADAMAAPAQEHATQLAGQGAEVIENLLRLAQIVDRAVEDWGESFADGSCEVKFHKDEADKMEAILEFFDSLPDAPEDEGVIESGPLKAARAIRAAAPAQALEDAPDAVRALIATHAEMLEDNAYAYFELAYTRQTGWMAWITDKPLYGAPVVNPDRKVLANGQGDTPDEACADAARAAQGGA